MEDLLAINIQNAQEDANTMGLAMFITQHGEEFWTGLWQAWMHNSPDHIKIYPATRGAGRRIAMAKLLCEAADRVPAGTEVEEMVRQILAAK